MSFFNGAPLVGAPKIAPAIVLKNEQTGEALAYPQAAMTLISDQILAGIVNAVSDAVIGKLIAFGVITPPALAEVTPAPLDAAPECDCACHADADKIPCVRCEAHTIAPSPA
jgi:hypothetical protein